MAYQQPTFDPSNLQPAMSYKAPPNRRALKWVLGIFLLLIAGLVGLLVLLLIGADIVGEGGQNGPVALMAGFIFATLPVPFYIMLVLWLDRYEAEPAWLLATAFIWGATFAAFIAFLINTIGGAIVTASADAATGRAFGAVISAPIVEESAKAFVLFVLFFWKKDEFDGIVDGVVYASMVALGFAMTENILYYGKAALGGGGNLTGTLMLRGAFSPFAHPLFTSMTGIGLGWSRQSDNKFVKFAMPIAGLFCAMLLHSTWNFSTLLAQKNLLYFIGVYFGVMVPIFVIALVIVFFGLRRESRLVREYLKPDVQSGLIGTSEYESYCTIRGRFGASYRALTACGISGWRHQRAINQLASELAFHRHRAQRGIYPNSEIARERESSYISQLYDLRRKLTAR